MEKISRIIPSSPRTKAVAEEGQPVRPGAPSLGRPMGKVTARNFFESQASQAAAKESKIPSSASTPSLNAGAPMDEGFAIKDKVSLSSAAKESESEDVATGSTDAQSFVKNDSALYNAKGERSKVQMIEDLSKKFFGSAPKSSMAVAKPQLEPIMEKAGPPTELQTELGVES